MQERPRPGAGRAIPRGDMSIWEAQRERLVASLREHLAARAAPAFDLTLPGGETHEFRHNGREAAGAQAAPAFKVHVRTDRGLRVLASFDEYAIAEAYVQCDFDIEGDFLQAFALRRLLSDAHPLLSMLRFLQPVLSGRNRSDKKAIAAHYDLGNEFYRTFLD